MSSFDGAGSTTFPENSASLTDVAALGPESERDRARPLPQIVSLFCGAGGMDLGFKQAGFKIPIAFDSSAAAIRSHKRNFRRTKSIVADLVELQPAGVLAHVRKRIPVGSRIGVIGGPPCQGFSRANTSAQSDDPRNALPDLYLRIVEALKGHYIVEFVVLENVLGIRDRKHAVTYKEIIDRLFAIGFNVTEKELCAADFGVPQNRRRILLSGMRKRQKYAAVKPRKRVGASTVKDAIGHIRKQPVFYQHGLLPEAFPVHPNHWTMQPRSHRFSNPDALSSEGRSFKRLEWDSASPTIAFGNREIHIHPSGKRRISIYEAMLLQGFPSTFVLEGNLSEQVEQVSNAVPPPLARSVARAVRRSLRQP